MRGSCKGAAGGHSEDVEDFLVIEQVSKSFGPVRAVDGVSLTLAKGEVFSLLGPSGCGKTTLLRLLAGFERPDAGRILLNGRDITALPPERRPVNTVFQNYALFPHLTVAENIAFGLKMARRPAKEVQGRVEEMLRLVRLQDQARKRPTQLSGGQRQRVAIARALVNEPEVLLLDEPLAALDLKLRQHMLSELAALHGQVGTTFVYVTHDQGEAMGLSDRIAVMDRGRVEQTAAPEVLYDQPATAFVAGFIGDANFLEGRVQEMPAQARARVLVEGFGFGVCEVICPRATNSGDLVRVMVRPERLQLAMEDAASGAEGRSQCAGVVEEVLYFGAHSQVRVRCGSQSLNVRRQQGRLADGREFGVGAKVWVSFAPEDGRVVAEG